MFMHSYAKLSSSLMGVAIFAVLVPDLVANNPSVVLLECFFRVGNESSHRCCCNHEQHLPLVDKFIKGALIMSHKYRYTVNMWLTPH